MKGAFNGRVRRAARDDVGALETIECESFGQGDRFSRKRFRYLLSTPNSTAIVAMRDGGCVGYGIALVNRLHNGKKRGRVYSLAVSRAERGRGVGARLLGILEDAIKRLGAESVTLETLKGKKGASGFFGKYGYRVVGTLAGYYSEGDGVRMVKSLVKPEPRGV